MSRARVLFLLVLLAGCGKPAQDAWQGYVEGEFILLASPYAGQLQKLYAQRGDRVQAGQPLFALEQESERAARTEAGQRLHAAEARLSNLQARRRPAEIDALRAELTQARAALELSSSQLAQQQALFKGGFIAGARLDEAQAARARDAARVAEADAQLRSALQPLGREAERRAAESDAAGAQAALQQAALRLEQKSVAATAAGLVQETYFNEGEWVPAGRPVVSLLPPENIKLRFYAAQNVLQSLPTGKELEVHCDGCEPIRAKVSYVSSQAEYTPPVLYSKESRHKLLFLVEARPMPGSGARLRPGQPVEVRLK